MEDYPANLMDFEARFATEEACRQYLFQMRWPEGLRCPRCGQGKAWTTGRGLYHCGDCGHEATVTAGTIFQDTRKPLLMWFRAMWWVTSQKNGASAMGLQHVHVLDPGGDPAAFEELLKAALAGNDTTFIVARRPCILAAKKIKEHGPAVGRS